MQALAALFTLLLVASAQAVPVAQSEQAQNPNSGEYSQPGHYQPVPPPAQQLQHGHSDHADYPPHPPSSYAPTQLVPVSSQSQSVAGQPPQTVGVHQQAPQVDASSGPVGGVGPVGVEQQPPHHPPSVASYYAPAGLINVVGAEQQAVSKPVGSVRSFEQYGQPESASIPANYKPFGSWGLYIGGNPADGYYTNYYKSLAAANVEKASESAKPVSPVAFNPVFRQAGTSPYVGNEYYSFAYAPSDLSSASQVVAVSPVQAGSQVYGSPSGFESNYGVSPYADAYATKRVGAAYAQKEAVKEVPAGPTKSYQARNYVYQAPVPAFAPVQPNQHVVGYPVPVGSQIVGSQPGVEGAFNPYGVHAFTRYAVKPTVVGNEPSYYYGDSSFGGQGVHSYNQQQSNQPSVYSAVKPSKQVAVPSSYYPSSYSSGYYGYPVSQLHYSQGSVGPQVGNEHGVEGVHHVQVQPNNQVEAASEKSETLDKSVNKQQKRA